MIKSKISYSNVFKNIDEKFVQAASEILGVDKYLIQVRKNIVSGPNYGKLSIFVFIDKENQEYWNLSEGEKEYYYLSPNLNEFKKELIKKI